MPETHSRELEVAVAAAREAGALLLEHYGRVRDVRFKSAVDPVTEADRASEALIRERLLAAFPDDRLLGEEGGETPPPRPPPLHGEGVPGSAACTPIRSPPLHIGEGDGGVGFRLWIVDPLDGTVNFLHGFPVFCVSIALLAGDDLAVGVIYDPLRDELFAARRGQGATLNGLPIGVSDTSELLRAMLATGFAYDIVHRSENLAYFARFIDLTQAVRRPGSAALDAVYVACGRLDGYWERPVAPWDVAAAALIAAEAGGTLSNYEGEPFDPFAREIVASNGRIHAAMLDAIVEVARGRPPDTPGAVDYS